MSHIKQCFTYVLSSNREKPDWNEAKSFAIPHQMFDDYQQCACFFKALTRTCPKNLVYENYLQNESLFDGLLKVFIQYSEIVEKLTSLESTQIYENFNQLISSKTPKNKFYFGSERTSHRVGAAVFQNTLSR